jgi:dihydroorotate dehydrogenase electron transfer subunit
MKAGDITEATAFLGRGFEIKSKSKYRRVALVGGGVGVAPLLSFFESGALPLLDTPKDSGIEFSAFLGFSSANKAILIEEFKAVCKRVEIATDDGSMGVKEFVTDLFVKNLAAVKPDAVFACGPKPMLKALAHANISVPVFVSCEEKMACGFGVCMVCVCQTADGYKRVCNDGPVFNIKELTL